MTQWEGWELPQSFSTVDEEHEAATSAVGLADRSHVGRLRLTGKDALDLLNRLSTNKLESLDPGAGVATVLTNNKGRIIDLLLVTQREAHLLLMTSPQNVQKVIDWIDLYTFLEEVSVENITDSTVVLHVLGPKAPDMLSSLTGQDVAALGTFASMSASIDGAEVDIIRTDAAGIIGYDLIAPVIQADQLWRALINSGGRLGLRPVGAGALEIIRIEHGIPAYGKELSEKVNPLEANLIDYISFSKGCYIGQEVVARLNTYEKVQKYLQGIVLESEELPPLGAKLLVDGAEVGFVTSVSNSLRLGRSVAIGYVKKAHAQEGLSVTVSWDGSNALATLVALPLTKTSPTVS